MMAEHGRRLGKLSLAILENFVEGTLGEKFVDELRAPTDRAMAIAAALGETETLFLSKFEDKDLARALFFDLKQADRPALNDAVGKFFDHPTDPGLRQALQKLLFDEFQSVLSRERIDKAVDAYMKLLTKELMLADEGFRDNIAALMNYEGNLAEQRSAELLEQIVVWIMHQQRNSQRDSRVVQQRFPSQAFEPKLRRREQVQIILDGTFSEFDEPRQKEVISVLAALLHVQAKSIKILRVLQGSVIFELEMEEPAVARLVELISRGDFRIKSLGILAVRLEDGKTLTLGDPAKLKVRATPAEGRPVPTRVGMMTTRAVPIGLMIVGAALLLGVGLFAWDRATSAELNGLGMWIFTVLGLLLGAASVLKGWMDWNRNIQTIETSQPFARSREIQMAQCNSVTRKGTRCTRNALPRSRYCWQHNTPFVITVFSAMSILVTVFLTGIGFWADLLTVLPTLGGDHPTGVVSGRPQEMTSLFDDLITRGQEAKNIGQVDEALNYFTQALEIARQDGDRRGEGLALNEIGTMHDDKGQYDEALEYYNQALVIRREVGDRSGEGLTLHNIGATYDDMGLYDQALEYYKQALVIRREVGARSGEGNTLSNIGAVYTHKGQYDQALEYYNQALVIRREVSDRSGEGSTLNNIGAAYYHKGQFDQALEYYDQALIIQREVGDRPGVGNTLHNIGNIYHRKGQYDQALEYYKQALVIRREVGDRPGEGSTLNNMGGAYNDQGQYDQALEYYRQALVILREVGDRAGEGNTLNNIGGAYNEKGQYDQALEYYNQALVIRREVGDRSGEGSTLNNIGLIYRTKEQFDQALEYFNQALVIRREVGDRLGEGITLNNIGLIYYDQGQYDEALEYYNEALIIAREVGVASFEETVLDNMSFLPTQPPP